MHHVEDIRAKLEDGDASSRFSPAGASQFPEKPPGALDLSVSEDTFREPEHPNGRSP